MRFDVAFAKLIHKHVILSVLNITYEVSGFYFLATII
jgi:hypothetical protein